MALTLRGCGYNGFKQISGFQYQCIEGWTSGAGKDGTCGLGESSALVSPFTMLKLHSNVQVQNIVFTWARIAATLRKADSKMVSLVAGRENLEGRLEGEAVSATDSHILLRRDGKAEPGFECLHDGDIQPQPFAVRNDKESSDLHIHCCHNDLYYSRGSLEFGKLASLEKKDEGKFPSLLQLCPLDMSLRIETVSCGREHVLFLSKFGCVYSSGLGSRGQLGHGDVEMEKTPRLIEALEGVRMTRIAAGGWHSTSVSEYGDVYTWGWNESGQLGLESPGPATHSELLRPGLVTEPQGARLPQDVTVKDVACGSRHTLLLSECGHVFASGWNTYGQLGLTHKSSQYTFVKIVSLGRTCTQIFAGHWCSIFICLQ